jgi:hypothetical protein
MFGETVTLASGQSATLGFDLEAVDGLKRAMIICGGKPVGVVRYAPDQTTAHLSTSVDGSTPGWCAVTVEDAKGMTAYTDPVWIAIAR